nr:chromo-helicase DNA-binding protein, putative [Babesia bovis]
MCKTKINEMTYDENGEIVPDTVAGKKRSTRSFKTIELGDIKIAPLEFIEKLKLLECLEDWGRSQAGPGWATSDKTLELPPEVMEQFSDAKDPWTAEDCVNLLKMIHIHGYGYWTLYCNDKTHCVGALEGMKHEKAKLKSQRLLKILYDVRHHLVNSKLPDLPVFIGAPQQTAKKNQKIEELNIDDDSVVGKDEDDESNIEMLITMGKPLKREHYPAAVKWTLRNGKDRLKRIKLLKDQDPKGPEFLKEVEEALPEIRLYINAAVEQCKDQATGQKLKSACWRFVSKFTLLTLEELEKEPQ